MFTALTLMLAQNMYMPGIPSYLNYIIIVMFVVSLALSLGAVVLGFGKIKVIGKSAYWFGLTAFFLLTYQVLPLPLGVAMKKDQGNTTLVFFVLWQLSMVLSVFCLLIGLLKTRFPNTENTNDKDASTE